MRFLFSLLLLTQFAYAADYIVNGRLQAEFSAIPANRVAQIRTLITNQYNKTTDLFGINSVEFQTETNSGIISGYLMLDFVVSNKTHQVWAALTNYTFPSGITGFVSIHQCAIDPVNTNGYVPCYTVGHPVYYRRKQIP